MRSGIKFPLQRADATMFNCTVESRTPMERDYGRESALCAVNGRGDAECRRFSRSWSSVLSLQRPNNEVGKNNG
jgi:hypothetical protein